MAALRTTAANSTQAPTPDHPTAIHLITVHRIAIHPEQDSPSKPLPREANHPPARRARTMPRQERVRVCRNQRTRSAQKRTADCRCALPGPAGPDQAQTAAGPFPWLILLAPPVLASACPPWSDGRLPSHAPRQGFAPSPPLRPPPAMWTQTPASHLRLPWRARCAAGLPWPGRLRSKLGRHRRRHRH